MLIGFFYVLCTGPRAINTYPPFKITRSVIVPKELLWSSLHLPLPAYGAGAAWPLKAGYML